VFIVLIGWYVFGFGSSSGILHQSLIYVIFPIVIWAALRFGQRGATICITLVSAIAISGTVRGAGPFSMGSLNDSLVLLQTFTGVLAFISLLLAASTIERQKASRALNQRVNNLVTLNDSSKRFLDNFDFISIYQTICELSVDRLGLDGTWIEIEGIEKQIKPSGVYGMGQDLMDEMKNVWEQNMTSRDWENVVIRTIDHISSSEDGNNNIFQSYAAFPLVFNGEKIGILKLLSKSKYFFTNECIQLTRSFANLAAAAIKNTWLYDQVQQGNKQLQALSQRLLKAHEDERLHLSRELHDESGQLLAALSVQMGILKRDSSNSAVIRQRISEVIGTMNELQKNLHKLAVNLRPASLDHLGLVNALQQHSEEFSRQYDIQVEFETVCMEDVRLSIEVETALFRIVQEALTNIALHSHATRIDVLISRNNDFVAVIVEDNGVGFKLASITSVEHLGLFGMRERIEMLGGEFTLESTIGKGTTVKVEIKLND
jgi:signal transduction histidine kinase